MEIMQLLQIAPQVIPTGGIPSEAPALPAGDDSLFASLFAGLLMPPVTTNAATQEVPDASSGSLESAARNQDQDQENPSATDAALASLVPPIPLPLPAEAAPAPESTVSSSGTAAAAPVAPVSSPVTTTVAEPLASTMAHAMVQTAPTEAPVAAASSVPAGQTAAVADAGAAEKPVEVLNVAVERTPVRQAGADILPKAEQSPQSVGMTEEATAETRSPVRTMGPTAAYPDRIPVRHAEGIPAGKADTVNPVEPRSVEVRADATTGSQVKALDVEVTVRDGSGEQHFAEGHDQAFTGKESTAMKDVVSGHATHEAGKTSAAQPTETRPTSESSHSLRDSIMAQVRDAVTTREPNSNGRIRIRLNPVELGELTINVRVADQQVKVDVVAANGQVRDILLNNLDNLKENFSRQNLTMTGFDVSTGTGQGFEHQLFREGGQAGQGGTHFSSARGEELDGDVQATMEDTRHYVTDRRENGLVDVRL
ncbi:MULTISPECIES: flagellar hook-length control protein FliK [Geobacter]|uniref:flagellar hook-length control protein FliK n=1 Tax=Geobacter TaxID=28231 RepID=UPI002573CD17|nr:flagellar hook-length control protein FliK [Geobacter sulfurreducens]BEH08756.1 flagellar hook-length control protein FliK [Geobacter sulfurreducens subsp. ethanolicus]BET60243.1 flagellar hook-length control protein FliK [Geobacter sp. 60473]